MLLQDRQALPSQYHKKVSNWHSSWKETGWVFLLSRLILLLVTFIGPSVFPHFEVEYHEVNHHLITVGVIHPPVQCAVELEHCLLAWDSWDVGDFVAVAHQGYPNSGDKQDLEAFFPLWPLVIHIVGDHFGDSYKKALFYVGLILSNVCFYFSLVLFYNLVSCDFSSKIAKNSLFFLALGPYALFFFIGYSESFFLLLCLGTFFFLNRGRSLDWWLAGLCGFLASLTRGTGFVLIIPFLVLLIQRFSLYRHKIQAYWCLLLNMALPLLLIPCGLFLYMVYLGITKGNPFGFSVAELTWGRQLDFPWAGLVNAVRSFFVYRSNFEENFTDLFFTLISLATLLVYWRRLPLHYSLFSLAMMIFSLSYPVQGPAYSLSASPRYMMVIFPLYILFAFWCKEPRIRDLLMGLSITLFTIFALLFICHGWVA